MILTQREIKKRGGGGECGRKNAGAYFICHRDRYS